MLDRIDDATLLALVRRLPAEPQGTWRDIAGLITPHAAEIVLRSRSMGPLRESDDHRRNVVTDVLDKLSRNNHRALTLIEPWLAANPGKTCADWLRVVVTNVVQTYVVAKLGPYRAAEGSDSAGKRLLHTLASALPDDDAGPAYRPPVTDQQTVREVLEYASAHLASDQLVALEAWLRHGDFAEIGRAAGGDGDPARAGEKLVRAALGRLRRHFAATPP